MWHNIEKFKRIIHIADYADELAIDRSNATRFWNQGKRTYLKEGEIALKIGRDWYVLSEK